MLVDRYGNEILPLEDIMVITGMSVVQGSGTNNVALINLNDLKSDFKEKYGVAPSNVNYITGVIANGNQGANAAILAGLRYRTSNSTFYACSTSNITGGIQINYAFFYDRSRGVED